MSLSHQITVIDKYLKKAENRHCADCKRQSPSWASLNLGVFVCINCSGCHREIGVHVTKIKSTNLDLWPVNTLVNFGKINNQIANNYWEQKLPSDFDFEKIKKDDYRLQDFIRDKYERRRYADIKKVDPMTLISQGFDVSKEALPINNGSTTWEDSEDGDNNSKRTHAYVKPKPGPNFNISSSKGDKKPTGHQHLQDNSNNTPKVFNNNDNGLLIDFDNVTSVNTTNNQQRVNLSNNNTDKKTTGFSFIKKNNTIPKVNNINPTSTVESDTDNFVQLTTSNNKNLLELFSVQSQPLKAVQDLSVNLLKVYQGSSETNHNQSQIKANYPPNTINYNYYQTPHMIPVNQPGMYQTQYPIMSQPNGFLNQPVNSAYYMERPNQSAQPYVLDLYNTEKEKMKPDQPSPFTYNSNYTDSLNPKKSNDPFKNLVSFN